VQLLLNTGEIKMDDITVGDIVNDAAGNAGEVVGLPEDGIAEVEWDNGLITNEIIGELILV
jgi:hypothetical protein